MNVIISGKDFSLTPSLKAYTLAHTKKLGRIMPAIQEIKIELDVDKNQHSGAIYRAEISVKLPGSFLKAGEKAEHMQQALDLCVPKLAKQLERVKAKKSRKQRS